MKSEWSEHERPPRLERRYVFTDYPELRSFLNRAATIFEELDYYPDLSFGRDYVNVTIHGYEQGLTDICRQVAERLEALWQDLDKA